MSHQVNLHLDERDFQRLAAVAERDNVKPGALARKWVLLRLDAVAAMPGAPAAEAGETRR